MELIDKASVVAEIEGYISNYKDIVAKIDRNYSTWVDSVSMIDAKIDVLQHLLSFLNTLEVKEVDLDELLSNLDKDIKEFVTTQEFENDSAVYGHYWTIAKHAFLFGLKVK